MYAIRLSVIGGINRFSTSSSGSRLLNIFICTFRWCGDNLALIDLRLFPWTTFRDVEDCHTVIIIHNLVERSITMAVLPLELTPLVGGKIFIITWIKRELAADKLCQIVVVFSPSFVDRLEIIFSEITETMDMASGKVRSHLAKCIKITNRFESVAFVVVVVVAVHIWMRDIRTRNATKRQQQDDNSTRKWDETTRTNIQKCLIIFAFKLNSVEGVAAEKLRAAINCTPSCVERLETPSCGQLSSPRQTCSTFKHRRRHERTSLTANLTKEVVIVAKFTMTAICERANMFAACGNESGEMQSAYKSAGTFVSCRRFSM